MTRMGDTEGKLGLLRRHLEDVASATGRELSTRLQVSQPVLSRLLARLGTDLIVAGRARATRYALRRHISGLGPVVPIYGVSPEAETRLVATLHAVHRRAFYVQEAGRTGSGQFYPGLPYFLHDMRPAGFLGRLVPSMHPDLHAASDILLWSDDDCLRYFARYGWDLPGSLLVGDAAFQAYLQAMHAPPAALNADTRAAAYVRYAADVLASGAAGSSAAGEQPKFLARLRPGGRAVLVKFSPLTGDAVGRRMADLFWCEHLMHRLLTARGCDSVRSEILEAGGRVFLQMDRFDRTAAGGRHGLVSLSALDLEFVGGDPHGWVASVIELARLKKLPEHVTQQVRWLALVGQLIGNTDMHGGNLAFYVRGMQPTGLAPVYDMLPMLYAPYQGHLPSRVFTPPLPTPRDQDVWPSACAAAMQFWGEVGSHARISADFRARALENRAKVEHVARYQRHLPGAAEKPQKK